MSKTFSSLRHYNYRLWFACIFISTTGSWMQRIAENWLVLMALTKNSAPALGVNISLQFIPQLLFSALAGKYADLYKRRRIVQICLGVLVTTSVVLAALVLSGQAHLWMVYVMSFISGSAYTFMGPSEQALVEELVGPDDVSNAVGLNSTAFNISRLFGPALAGFCIYLVGVGWVFALNAILLCVPLSLIFAIREKLMFAFTRTSAKKGLTREAFTLVWQRPDLVALIFMAFVTATFTMNYQLNQVVMATLAYGKGPGEYGALGSIIAIGSVIGALLATRRQKQSLLLVLGAAFILGIFTAGLALAPNYLIFAVLLVPTGFFMLTMLVASNALIQTTVPQQIRGRIMALYLLASQAPILFGSPLAGFLIKHFGPRASLAAGGIAAMTAAIITLAWYLPQRRRRAVLVTGE